MSNEELNDQYELFVLGLADPAADAEIRARIEAGDAEVTRGVDMARMLVAGLSLTAPEVEAPERLKKRVMAAVRREPSGFPGWIWAWAAATALLAFLTFNFWQREATKNAELTQVRQELTEVTGRLQNVSQILEFLNEPQLKVASFGQAQPQPPNGRVLVSPTRGVLLLVNNLPPAEQGRTYEMWVVPKKGNPIPAGVFQTGGDGRALHVRPGVVDVGAAAAIAISVEPQGGSPAPTTTPFVIAPLGD